MHKIRKEISTYLLAPSNSKFDKIVRLIQNQNGVIDRENATEVYNYLIKRINLDLIRFHLSYTLFMIERYNESYYYIIPLIEKKYYECFKFANTLACKMHKIHTSHYLISGIKEKFGEQSKVYIFEKLRYELTFTSISDFEITFSIAKSLVKDLEDLKILIFSCIESKRIDLLARLILQFQSGIDYIPLTKNEFLTIRNTLLESIARMILKIS
ncbi:hypothetical protein [Leptospira bandrabouensis]|uniref:hypothetical protein n=1 Tax=Leptospira bandrabouensis TaxID=2484903 RepID=UPI001EE983C6|nr:hypothetical protein [Leptospira bandrabouensis]MCG6146571.1 hypothetical protein [Leptospira bandrabouensis]MCG6161978.1 hypothetical protein [Leptospira bandrabouensis]MCG6166162.1 hypothetical protein [Leptospira bandrabouensis]